MKLVIDIPEEIYFDVQSYKILFEEYRDEISDAILNGVLIDRKRQVIDKNDLIEKLEEARYWDKETKSMENPLSKGLERAIQIVKEYCEVK